MRLDMKRESELARRKGLTGRTIIAFIWLAVSTVIAYFVTGWLQSSGTFTTDFFYDQLFVPRTVDPLAVRIGFIIIIVAIMQLFLLFGFAFSSTIGRYRPGTPTAQTRNPDPYGKKYDYH